MNPFLKMLIIELYISESERWPLWPSLAPAPALKFRLRPFANSGCGSNIKKGTDGSEILLETLNRLFFCIL